MNSRNAGRGRDHVGTAANLRDDVLQTGLHFANGMHDASVVIGTNRNVDGQVARSNGRRDAIDFDRLAAQLAQ